MLVRVQTGATRGQDGRARARDHLCLVGGDQGGELGVRARVVVLVLVGLAGLAVLLVFMIRLVGELQLGFRRCLGNGFVGGAVEIRREVGEQDGDVGDAVVGCFASDCGGEIQSVIYAFR
jgi:hypothetical protein